MIYIKIILSLFYFILIFNKPKIDYSQKIPDSDFSIDMVSIEGGDFIMGNYNDNVKTKISPFWISKYEITWEIFNLSRF